MKSLEACIKEYEKSWLYGRSHYERAVSLLPWIKRDTSDEAFQVLMEVRTLTN